MPANQINGQTVYGPIFGDGLTPSEQRFYRMAVLESGDGIKELAYKAGMPTIALRQALHCVYVKLGGSRLKLMYREIERLRGLVEASTTSGR